MPLTGFLKQSTAVTVMVGPFVDQGDGVTPETGLTLDTSFVKVSKNGAAFAGKSDTTAGTHAEDGYYRVELDTTDVNTVGILTLKVTDSDALPVRQDFQVLEEVVYDDLIGTSAAGYPASSDVWAFGTRVLTANTNLNDPTAATIADAVWDEKSTDHATAGSFGARQDKSSDVWAFGTRVLTANTNLNDPTAATIADAVWDEKSTDHVTAGSFGNRQDKSSDVWAFATRILTANTNLNDPTAATIADAVWNELSTDHTAAGSFGLNLDAQVSTVGGGSLTTTDIAQKVWNTPTTDHTAAGSFGLNLDAQVSTVGGGSLTTTDIAQKVWNTQSSDHVAAGSFGNEVQAHALSTEISALNDAAASDVWAFGTRVLTANTNLNDPTAATIADAVWDEKSTDHTTATSFGARQDKSSDVWAFGTRVLTANTNLNDPTAAAIADQVWDEQSSDHVAAGSLGSEVQSHALSTEISALNDPASSDVWAFATRTLTANTNLNDPASSDMWAFGTRTLTAGTNLNDVAASDIMDFQLTDAVSADGTLPTVQQAVYEIVQFLQEKSISGTTVTVRKQDGSTSLMTFTLDSASAPTSITRAS